MNLFNRHTGWLSMALVAVMTLVTIAPAAEAGNGNGRGRGHDRDRWEDRGDRHDRGDRWKNRRYRGRDRIVRQVYVPRRDYRYRDYGRRHRYAEYRVVRRSDAGPVIAGFIGGLFLGATLANAAPAGYEYYDPYCHKSYNTLSSYHGHLANCNHENTVRVRERERVYEREYEREVSHESHDGGGYYEDGY